MTRISSVIFVALALTAAVSGQQAPIGQLGWATWDGDFEFRRTEYDVPRAAAGYRSMGGDFGEFAATRIERGSD